MTYAYQVLRWPFAASGADLTFNFRDKSIPASTSAQAIAAGTYICDGSDSAVAPVDMVRAFEAAAQAAATAIGTVGGTITATMNTAGHLVVAHAGAGNLLELYGATATQQAWLGLSAATWTVSGSTGTYQMFGQWHPGIDADYDSGDLQRQIVSEGRNLKGRVRRVVRSYAPWDERRLDWSRVAGGRMSAARAATAAFATVAGITTGEGNTWESMWRYLTGDAGPYGDNRVYVYSTNDPSTATRTGPYDVVLSECEPGLAGLPAGGYVQGMASEYYAVKIALVEGGA
jgi:hypothetical protein